MKAAPTPDSISLASARSLALQAQGLHGEAAFGRARDGTLRAIRHLGYVQIDTIAVVERAHHHVLWSRVPDYEPRFLGELQAPRDGSAPRIYEYWSHAAAYLPIEDYRYGLPRMDRLAKGARHWFARNRKLMTYVLDRIEAEGPLMARDFEAPKGQRAGPWFDWKPAKKALEQLFMEGRLMIRERRGFQKVYDLTDRVLPAGVDRSRPTSAEMARYLVRRTLGAHGLAREEEMRYLRKDSSRPVAQALRELEEAGEIRRLRVEGDPKGRYFASARELARTAPEASFAPRARILSPFDNAVIQRKRLQRLFGFDYQIECYVPEPKRRFGYFCLPLLYADGSGDRFIGRIDAKADRAEKRLDALKIILEPGIRHAGKVKAAVARELDGFARFNGAESSRILKVSVG